MLHRNYVNATGCISFDSKLLYDARHSRLLSKWR